MKVIRLLCPAMLLLAAFIAQTKPVRAVSLTFDASPYTHLTDMNQSQTFETVSVAGRPGGLSAYQIAGVYFIAGSKRQSFDTPDNDFNDPSGENCKRLGFAVSSCASGLFNKACPYNDQMYDRCCEATYKYTSANCLAPKTLSSDTCGGKHGCSCPAASYPYASCNAPQIKGAACSDDSGTRYASCSCPSSVSAPYGCKEYYAAPCGSICKTAYPDACHYRDAVQTPYGCLSFWGDCSSKCQTAYPDNCRNRNAVSAPYGCQQAYSDCQSKCEIAYSDNCRNRSAVIVNCPANASCSYFSDCSSKIQSWSCNSGYQISGSSCVKSCTPGCTNQNNCSWGSKTVSDGCGGTCVQCYPACQAGYKYRFSSADCFVRPAKYLWQSSNPNCGKCECDNRCTRPPCVPCSIM